MSKSKRRAEDFAAEIQSHLALEADELKREGLSEGEAQRRAHVEFGSVSTARERFYLRSRVVWLDNLARDAKFALRQLARGPGFAITAIVVLALGIGASVAIFAFVDAALLEPLPYTDPNHLVQVDEGNDRFPDWPLSYPDFLDWQRLNHSFSSLDVFSPTGFLLRSGAVTEPVQAMRVSGGFFQTLGVHPSLGRDFNPGEDRVGGPNVVLLSYSAWLHRFGARRDLIGQVIDLDGAAYTVIGVLPREFSFAILSNAEFWVPINRLSFHEHSRGFYAFMGIGRLRKGVSVQSALADMKTIAAQLQRQYPTPGREASAGVVLLSEVVTGNVRPILLTLLGGAGLLLLIACVNVASLILLRSETRRREIAVRSALGATPSRLLRQFVAEGLVFALTGCAAGIAVAAGFMRVLSRLVPKDMAANMPFLSAAGFSAHTGWFISAIALSAAFPLAITPILRLSFQPLRDGLVDGDRSSAGRVWRSLGTSMVVVELAVAVVLLAGAGLLGKSFYKLLHVPLGFEPDHLATVAVMAPNSAYTTDEQVIALYREIVRRTSILPGAKLAGVTSLLPVQCDCGIDRISFPGRPYHGEHNDVDERHISPNYLPALGAKLISGRFFTESDDASHPGVAVINQTLARTYFPGHGPVGQRIADDEGGNPAEWTIVGVIEDVREGPLDAPVAAAEYFPINQTRQNEFSLAVRTSQDAGSQLPELVSTLQQIDPNLGVSNEATMDEKVGATQAALLHRFSAWLVSGFATMSLVLGVIGLYGVVAYLVSQRTREIGVRMALGAQRSSVYSLVMRQAGWLTLAGLAIGLVCSLGTSMLIRSLLFGVQPWDGLILVCSATLLGLASMAASFLPARRAASVDPVEALRAE